MHSLDLLKTHISHIEKRIGYTFHDPALLVLAFVHRSFINEHRFLEAHNERLEFLGDSVLGLLISEYLYRTLPQMPEGDLSYLRSRLVDASSCVNYVQTLEVSSFVLLGKGERLNEGKGRETILADLFEAIVGAIYLDGGIEAARSFIFSHFSVQFEQIIKSPLHNWKALLQDYCQKKFQKAPSYELVESWGPEHSREFLVAAYINGEELGRGNGCSKKEAQQAAAKNAAFKLNMKT